MRPKERAEKTLIALRAGWKEAGLSEHDVVREMTKRHAAHERLGDQRKTIGGFSPHANPRTLRRYLAAEGGIPLGGREATGQAVAALAELTNSPEHILKTYLEEIDQYLLRPSVSESESLSERSERDADRSSPFPRVLFGVIPKTEDREYSSLDQITFLRFDEDDVSGIIRRMQPPSERGFTWKFNGNRHGLDLFLTFLPVHGDPISRGVIMLHPSSTRPLEYEGIYRRPSFRPTPERPWTQRPYRVTQNPPQEELGDVAVLDFDGTFRAGWLVFDWVRSLSDAGITGASETLVAIDRLRQAYHEGELTHDELARSCAEEYAQLESTISDQQLADEAQFFATRVYESELFPWVSQFLEVVREASVAPVLVTGAPQILIDLLGEYLNIDLRHGLQCNDGVVVVNPGTAEKKRSICLQMSGEGKRLVLAAGDSSSDLQMLLLSDSTIVVGDALPEFKEGESCLRIDSSTPVELLTDWVAQALDQ